MNLEEIRIKYPMYNDMPDEELADAFHANVVAEELWSVFQTGSTEEKIRVLRKIAELDAIGRTGEEYRWLWQGMGR